MCELCTIQAETVVKDVLPGYDLVRGTKRHNKNFGLHATDGQAPSIFWT